ncbi:hypothetical protein AB7179_03620 [Providencia manganoxydans]|uniref:hypothetical protein n=1 Tax=Providencia manganoxydans TaxID=2923283 RepID=UPI0034E5B74E
MNHVAQMRELLAELMDVANSPVYAICIEIVSYLEHHPQQKILTIGGLRAALHQSEKNDSALIQAAYTLTSHPFFVLEVNYKLYDSALEDVIEELDHSAYMEAISQGYFIDKDGNEIINNELNKRVFPYFVNQYHRALETKVDMRFE